VNADIVGTSTLHSASLPKQESSTATSKSYTFREGVLALLYYYYYLVLLSYILLKHDFTFTATPSVGDRVRYVGPAQPPSLSQRYLDY
jgi:hypothetical protein